MSDERLRALDPHGPWDNVTADRLPSFRHSGNGKIIRVVAEGAPPSYTAYHHGPGRSSYDDPLFETDDEQAMVERLTGHFEHAFTGVGP